MGSACPYIEEYVGAASGVHSVRLNRTSSIIEVAYDPGQTTPGAII